MLGALLLLGALATAQETKRHATEDGAYTIDLPAAWVLVLVVLPLVLFTCWLGYRGERLAPIARFALTGLRFGAIVTLLVVLFRPVLVQHREEVQKAEVIVLVDDSASMQRKVQSMEMLRYSPCSWHSTFLECVLRTHKRAPGGMFAALWRIRIETSLWCRQRSWHASRNVFRSLVVCGL